MVSSLPFQGGNSGPTPECTTKNYGLSCSKEANWSCTPVGGVRFPYGPRKHFGSLAQLEERFIITEEVTGPNPVCIHYAALAKMVYARDWKSWDSRSLREGGTNKLSIGITIGSFATLIRWRLLVQIHPYGLYGIVVKWSNTVVCLTIIRGSESRRCR